MTDTTIGQNDGLRNHLHGMWSAVAPGWAAHADFIDDRGVDVTDAMLFITAPQPGERVLELACGPGGPGFAAAPLVAPGGAVVVSDVSAEMTSIAAARARERRLGSVSCRVLDLEEIDEPDASFDVVLCREGLMLVADPARAAAEVRRVLAPGGRVVSPSGAHASAIRGWESCSTSSAPSSGCRSPRPGSRTRSRWTTPAGSPRC